MTAETARNRMGEQSSTYLRSRAGDPVGWWPWGDEALDRARRENKPIFLSSGYQTCKWCHTMARESFGDRLVAERLNREFVCILLDREEHPEVDEIYMAATQLLTHRGGWPNTVFLTPDLGPYFAGTYFPSDDRPETPGFLTVVESMAHAFRERREDVEEQARELVEVMGRYLGGLPSADAGAVARPVTGEPLAARSLQAMEATFDPENGGFGGAPRFPRPAHLLLLLELAERHEKAARMLDLTLDAMSRGGIFDHLGGGFHRHAREADWRIPSFEKTLADNGWLLEIFARRQQQVPTAELATVVRRTADFLLSELLLPEGGFARGLDGSSHGHEGAYYIWSLAEIVEAVGAENAGFLAPLLGFDGEPSFEEDFYVLHRPRSPREQAARRRMTTEQLRREEAPMLDSLLARRRDRERPALDSRRFVAANGLAIAGLAAAGTALADPDLVRRAGEAASSLLAGARAGGTLQRSWGEGSPSRPALLADYAFLSRGLLGLFEATGEDRWLEAAEDLAREQWQRLGDPESGFFNAPARRDLVVRSRDVFDGAQPSAFGQAVLSFHELARHGAGTEPWGQRARQALESVRPVLAERAEGTWSLALAALRLAGGEA